MRNYKEKICLECGKTFKPNSSTQKYCKECKELTKQNYNKNYYIKNKDELIVKSREYRQNNTEKIKKNRQDKYKTNKENILNANKISYKKNKQKRLEYFREYYNSNKKTILENRKEYSKNNRDKINKHLQYRYYNDTEYKLKKIVRQSLKRCLNSEKDKHTFDILGYTPLQLKQRLEFQFRDGMNWDNYGTLWHIDHKKPLSLFDFELPNGEIDYKQIRLANSLCNLQPMLAKENLSKGNKFILK